MNGQGNYNSSSMADAAFQPDLAAMHLDDAIHNGQAEPRTLAGGLGREEWRE